MDYALYPKEGGLPRLWRYVEAGTKESDDMTSAGIVTTLDASQNLLFINRPLFDQLSGVYDQHIVLRTHARHTYV